LVGSIAALAEAEGVAAMEDVAGAGAEDGAEPAEVPPQAVRPNRAEAARPAIAKDVRFVASMTFLLQTD
jgi:hypothetical protein